LVVLPVGTDDVQRVSTGTRVIAVDMPNTQSVDALDWHEYRTSVDAIEDSTGLDLMSLVSAGIQAALEAQVDNGPTQ
jgi:endonuclease G